MLNRNRVFRRFIGGDSVPLLPPPTPVQLFSVRSIAGQADVGVNDFDVVWTGILRVDVYRSVREDGTLGSFDLVGNFSPPGDNLIQDPVDANRNYYYQFKSVGDGITYSGESDFSDMIAALLEPQNFILSGEGGGVVRFTWDYIVDFDGTEPSQDFQLQWSLVNDFSVLEGDTNLPPAASTNDVINGLTPGLTYYFRVRARDSNSIFSSWSSLSIVPS